MSAHVIETRHIFYGRNNRKKREAELKVHGEEVFLYHCMYY